MSLIRWQALTILVLICTSTSRGDAAPGQLGAVGDSISTGFDAKECDGTIADCVTKIGEHREYSWTTGYDASVKSIRQQFGYSATVERQANGKRWDDALNQVNGIIAAGGADRITIELGGNDVCRPVFGTLPPLYGASTPGTMEYDINSAFSAIVNAPAGARPSQVIVASVPNVNSLRNVMVNEKHFLFDSCQGLWDDLSGTTRNAKTCNVKWYNPISWLCPVADLLNKWTNWVQALKNAIVWAYETISGKSATFPCGYVLNSAATAQQRSDAANFNSALNSLIASYVQAYNGRNGVQFLWDNYAVYNFSFTTQDVSHLDCFHPSRQGQNNFAQKVGAAIATPSPATTAAYGTSAYTGGDWAGGWLDASNLTTQVTPLAGSSAPSGKTWPPGQAANSAVSAQADVWAQNYGYDQNYGCAYSPCYLGKIRETPNYHQFNVQFQYANGSPYPAYGYDYWRTWVMTTDQWGSSNGYAYPSPWR